MYDVQRRLTFDADLQGLCQEEWLRPPLLGHSLRDLRAPPEGYGAARGESGHPRVAPLPGRGRAAQARTG